MVNTNTIKHFASLVLISKYFVKYKIYNTSLDILSVFTNVLGGKDDHIWNIKLRRPLRSHYKRNFINGMMRNPNMIYHSVYFQIQ